MKTKLTDKNFHELKTLGATVFPILRNAEIKTLLDEAGACMFTSRDGITETNVDQHFLGCDTFEKTSAFISLARKTEKMLQPIFGTMIDVPIQFNDYSLQKYPISKPEHRFAISPHRDHKYCINVIAIYVLEGEAPFFISANKSAMNATEIKTKPGDLILMRGFQFLESPARPLHFLGKVTKERLSFGLRQVTEGKVLPKSSL